MPTFKITDPSTGKTVRLTGESAPTEQEINDVFTSLGGSAPQQAAPTPQTEPQQTGFISNVLDAGNKRLSNISNPKTSAVRSFSPTLGSLVNVAGQAGGFLNDVAGNVIKSGYEALPTDVQQNIAGVGKLIRTNPIVDAAMSAYGALPEDVRNDIGNVTNSVMIGPNAKLAGTLRPVAKEGANIARDVVSAAITKTPGILDADLANAVNKGIDKAIRPTVVGKRTAPQVKAYYDKAKTAVKTIIDNKDNLILTDAEGNATTGLPKTLKQFSEAVDQTKRNVFQQYDDMAKAAGDVGVEVDLSPAVKELESIAGNKVIADLSPEVANYATQRAEALSSRGFYTATEAQDAIAHLNKSLESFYKNPSYETANRAGVDSLIVNNIRKSLDGAIEGVSGAGYQDLKNTYGALKTIEKEVNHRAVVDARKNTKGLLDYTDILTSADLIAGLMTMNPTMILSGTVGRAAKEIYKKINNPNYIVKGMFADAEKILNKSVAQPEMKSGLGKLWQGKQYTGPTINGPYAGGMEVGPVRSGVLQGEAYGPQPGRLVYPKQLPAGQGFELRGAPTGPDVIDARFTSKSTPIMGLPAGEKGRLALPQGQGFELRDNKNFVLNGQPYAPDVIDVPFTSRTTTIKGLPAVKGRLALPSGQGFELRDQPALAKPEPKGTLVKPEAPIGDYLRQVRERQAPAKEGAQNLVTRIQELGGIQAGKDYNAKLLRQNTDAKRVLNNANGKAPDEIASQLMAEGWPIESADHMIELLKSGKGRKIYSPEKADSLYNRDIRSAENEWINQKLSEIENPQNVRSEISANREHFERSLTEEIRSQGIINPAKEDSALKEISDFFSEVSGEKPSKSTTKGKLTATKGQGTPASKGMLMKRKE